MHTFRDNAGREWLVEINVTAIKRCRALLGVDLYGLVDAKFEGLGKLLADPVGLIDVVYVLCKAEADGRAVSDEDFGRAMWGDAIDHAKTAFHDELIAFFPSPAVRAGLKRVMEASQKIQDRMMEHLTSQLDRINPDAEASKLISSSGGSPDTSGLPPDPSPSESSP